MLAEEVGARMLCACCVVASKRVPEHRHRWQFHSICSSKVCRCMIAERIPARFALAVAPAVAVLQLAIEQTLQLLMPSMMLRPYFQGIWPQPENINTNSYQSCCCNSLSLQVCFIKMANRPTANVTFHSCNTSFAVDLSGITPKPAFARSVYALPIGCASLQCVPL